MSDAGASFEKKFGGLSGFFKTALRASDILTERVGQLEYESLSLKQNLKKSQSNEFPTTIQVCITHKLQENDNQLPVESEGLQYAIQGIRTDLDCFSNLEIRALVRHGYSTCRQAILSQCQQIDTQLDPGKITWDPINNLSQEGKERFYSPKTENENRTKLLKSEKRSLRIFAPKDWVTWFNLFVLLLLGLLVFQYVNNNITRSSFLKDSYPLQFEVTFNYDSDFARNYAEFKFQDDQETLRRALHYFDHQDTSILDENIIGKDNKKSILQMYQISNRVGEGRAYLSETVLFEGESNKGYKLWQGTLYYEFPLSSDNIDWPGTTIDRMLGNLETLLIDFEGWEVEGDKVCVRLLQHKKTDSGEKTYDQLMELIFDVDIKPDTKQLQGFYKGTLNTGGIKTDLTPQSISRAILSRNGALSSGDKQLNKATCLPSKGVHMGIWKLEIAKDNLLWW